MIDRRLQEAHETLLWFKGDSHNVAWYQSSVIHNQLMRAVEVAFALVQKEYEEMMRNERTVDTLYTRSPDAPV